MQFTNVHLNFSGILLKIGWTCTVYGNTLLWRPSKLGYHDARTESTIYCDYLLRNTPHGAKYFTNRIRSGSKCLIVHQGWLPSNPGEQMCFQSTADLDTLSNYSRRAKWGGGGIGWTKDDIISMILALNQEWSTCCMASSDSVELWPWTKLKRPADASVFLSFAFHTIL